MENPTFVRDLLKAHYYPGLPILIELKSNWSIVLMSSISQYCSPFKVFTLKDNKFDLYISTLPQAILDVRSYPIKNKISLYFGRDIINNLIIMPITE